MPHISVVVKNRKSRSTRKDTNEEILMLYFVVSSAMKHMLMKNGGVELE